MKVTYRINRRLLIDLTNWIDVTHYIDIVNVPVDGLVNFQAFDDGTGNIAADAINGKDGTFSGAGLVWANDSTFGTVLHLTGGSYVRVPSIALPSIYTISFQAKIDSTYSTRCPVISMEVAGRTFRINLCHTPTQVEYLMGSGGSWGMIQDCELGVSPVNSWIHYMIDYDGTTARIFCNNNIFTHGYTGALDHSAQEMRFGQDSGAEYVKGYLHNIRMWNRTLTESERAAVFGSDT